MKEFLLNKITAAWGYVRHGPAFLVMYVFGRFGLIRSIVLFVNRSRATTVIGHRATSLLQDIDIGCAARNVVTDGFFPGLRLRPEIVEALHGFSTTATCFAEEHFQLPFTLAAKSEAERYYRKKISVGRIDNALETCPELQVLAADPTIIAIAHTYLGCQPVLLGSRIWWSFATEADESQQISLAQQFHYDLDGYRAVAFFFYLTDVDSASGPHVCVRGSHVRKPLRSLLSLHRGKRDAHIDKWYGKESQVMLCGPAGFGFAEDIFCFHKGLHPTSGDRLMLQLRYGIREYVRKNENCVRSELTAFPFRA